MAESGQQPEMVQPVGSGTALQADFPRQLDLSLDEDHEGNLIESPEARFFTVGKEFPKHAINWKGRVTVQPSSMIAPSPELERQRKMELSNMIFPMVQTITQYMLAMQFEAALGLAKSVVQTLEIQDEKPGDWLPDKVVMLIEHPEKAAEIEMMAKMQAQGQQPLMGTPEEFAAQAESGGSPPVGGAPGGQGGIPTAPGAQGPATQGVAPQSMVTNSLRSSLQGSTAQRMTR